jgi:hypothetical protein
MQIGKYFAIGSFCNSRPGQHNDIQTGQLRLMVAKAFSYQPLYSIAANRGFFAFFRNHQPQAACIHLVGPRQHSKQCR